MYMAFSETTQEEIMLRDQPKMVRSAHPNYKFNTNLKSANTAAVSHNDTKFNVLIFCCGNPKHPGIQSIYLFIK